MADTTPLGFPFPEDTDYGTGADVPRAMEDLANALDDYLTGTFKLVQILTVTSGVTFVPGVNTAALYVECVGGGGAGGGCTTAATNSAAGGGGGGGGYATVWTTTIKASFTIAIGAGGAGAFGSIGGAGGSTTFDSPSICTATGGQGGGARTVAAPPLMGGAGGTAGSGTVGDVLGKGSPGEWGVALAAAQAGGGNGGGSIFGGGAAGLINVSNNGQPSVLGYGGGGSGGTIISGGATCAGGDGKQGAIRVWEFQGGPSGIN